LHQHVRLAVYLAALASLMAVPTVTSACPPAAACLAKLRAGLREPLKPPETMPLASVTRSLQLPLAPTNVTADAVGMPWIWRALRERVHSEMPSYRDRNDLKVVLAPFVVTSPSDTVPALGIAGAF
jgi:hypothetical protein